MKECISNVIRKIGVYLQEDDTPSDEEISSKKYTIENPVTSVKLDPKPSTAEPSQELGGLEGSESNKPKAEISDKVRESKRPHIKPPRREEAFKTKWKGEGKREVRNEYQKQYRSDHGNT